MVGTTTIMHTHSCHKGSMRPDNEKLSRYAGQELMSGLLAPGVPYSAKFSWVFNFVNFTNFQPFTKLFQQNLFTRELQFSHTRASMDNMLPNPQGTFSKEILSK